MYSTRTPTRVKPSALSCPLLVLCALRAPAEPSLLKELRRQRTEPYPQKEQHNYAAGGDSQAANEIIFRHKKISCQIHQNGDISYFLNARKIVVDEGAHIQFLQKDNLAIAAGLSIAQQKFGSKIALSGTTDFKETAATIAAEQGMDISFTDKKLNDIADAL